MEAIITVVGFLGAGKTTLLKYLTTHFVDKGWNPFIILNDYENANLDAQQFISQIESKAIKALSGSCICCNGIVELRNTVNRIPERLNGITLIEANGTSDACTLMEFLAVGLNDRFLPPIQIAVVDVKNWQKRSEHNDLEFHQIQVASLIVLTHITKASASRQEFVFEALKVINPQAKIVTIDEIDITLLPELLPVTNTIQKFDHQKTHWSSCSTDLPNLPDLNCIHTICSELPKQLLRVKGFTKIGDDKTYTYFERKPDGEIHIRPFNGIPVTGPKLLTIGPGSEPSLLKKIITQTLLFQNHINN